MPIKKKAASKKAVSKRSVVKCSAIRNGKCVVKCLAIRKGMCVTAYRKPAPKKRVVKRVIRKPASKKRVLKKKPAKKASKKVVKKAASKKVVSKKAATKKVASKKAATKKVVKKVVSKKVATKKVVKKVASKTAPKKVSPKPTAAASKKVSPRTTTPDTVPPMVVRVNAEQTAMQSANNIRDVNKLADAFVANATQNVPVKAPSMTSSSQKVSPNVSAAPGKVTSSSQNVPAAPGQATATSSTNEMYFFENISEITRDPTSGVYVYTIKFKDYKPIALSAGQINMSEVQNRQALLDAINIAYEQAEAKAMSQANAKPASQTQSTAKSPSPKPASQTLVQQPSQVSSSVQSTSASQTVRPFDDVDIFNFPVGDEIGIKITWSDGVTDFYTLDKVRDLINKGTITAEALEQQGVVMTYIRVIDMRFLDGVIQYNVQYRDVNSYNNGVFIGYDDSWHTRDNILRSPDALNTYEELAKMIDEASKRTDWPGMKPVSVKSAKSPSPKPAAKEQAHITAAQVHRGMIRVRLTDGSLEDHPWKTIVGKVMGGVYNTADSEVLLETVARNFVSVTDKRINDDGEYEYRIQYNNPGRAELSDGWYTMEELYSPDLRILRVDQMKGALAMCNARNPPNWFSLSPGSYAKQRSDPFRSPGSDTSAYRTMRNNFYGGYIYDVSGQNNMCAARAVLAGIAMSNRDDPFKKLTLKKLWDTVNKVTFVTTGHQLEDGMWTNDHLEVAADLTQRRIYLGDVAGMDAMLEPRKELVKLFDPIYIILDSQHFRAVSPRALSPDEIRNNTYITQYIGPVKDTYANMYTQFTQSPSYRSSGKSQEAVSTEPGMIAQAVVGAGVAVKDAIVGAAAGVVNWLTGSSAKDNFDPEKPFDVVGYDDQTFTYTIKVGDNRFLMTRDEMTALPEVSRQIVQDKAIKYRTSASQRVSPNKATSPSQSQQQQGAPLAKPSPQSLLRPSPNNSSSPGSASSKPLSATRVSPGTVTSPGSTSAVQQAASSASSSVSPPKLTFFQVAKYHTLVYPPEIKGLCRVVGKGRKQKVNFYPPNTRLYSIIYTEGGRNLQAGSYVTMGDIEDIKDIDPVAVRNALIEHDKQNTADSNLDAAQLKFFDNVKPCTDKQLAKLFPS